LRRRIALQLEMEVPQSDEQWLDISIYTAENGISVFTRDVSERKRAESALYTLSSRLLNLQDEERRRIARELHDGTAQNVMAVLLNLARVSSKLPEPDEDGRRLVAESTALIEQSLAEIRTLSYWLHPPLLDEAGLLPTLRWYVDGFMKRSGIKIDLHVASANLHLRPEVEMTLFRVVQECLGNVHRHSGASAAIIHLSHNSKQTVLTVTDNGHGGTIRGTLEDANDINSLGVGLAGMNARLKQLGGHLKIVSSRQGTSVQAVIGNVVPIPGDHREATWSSSAAPGSEPLSPRSLKSRAGAIDDVERRDSTDPQVEGRIGVASRGGRNEMGIAAPSAPSDS
jgi:signal transduction histidine kinase